MTKPSVLAIIPARGGSKGLRLKNIRKVGGVTLICRAIRESLKSGLIDRVIVSTDNPIIAAEASRCGAEVPFLRPKEIARDMTPVSAAVRHAIDFFMKSERKRYDVVVLLQPTSPLRRTSHIDRAIRLFLKGGCGSVVSVTPVGEHPARMVVLDGRGRARFIVRGRRGVRRQDLGSVYKVNGAVYVFSTTSFLKSGECVIGPVKAMIMNRAESIDIDTAGDLAAAEAAMKRERRG